MAIESMTLLSRLRNRARQCIRTTARFLIALLCIGIFSTGEAEAQLNVEVTVGTRNDQVPVATATFVGESGLPVNPSEVIRADLQRSGRLRNVDAGPTPLSETVSPDYLGWKGRGAVAFVVGSVTPVGGGKYEVRFRLYDVNRQVSLGGLSYTVSASQLRLTAHKIADYVYEKLLGERGVFATRLSYVTKVDGQYKLMISDSDGQNPLVALTSREPIISPTWSPDGTRVAYVSFESRKPVVYLQNLVTGERAVISNQKGNNSAPSWSPDGRRVALALSRDGNTQVYLVNADGSSLRRLSMSSAIDTEPQFSSDGKYIYFTSDRGGAPQIYRMPADQGEQSGGAQRVSFKGGFNTSPRLSPDGKLLAFVSRVGGAYRLHVQDLISGEVTALTETSQDESPTFAANGKFLLYATRIGGRNVLGAVSVDGRARYTLQLPFGDVREPAWGPFMQ